MIARWSPPWETELRPAETPADPHGRSIENQARLKLKASGHAVLAEVDCTYQRGVLILHGCVPSFYLKQVAQTVVVPVAGVTVVENQIEVAAP